MIYRIDVRTTGAARGGNAAVDPVGEALRHQIAEFGSNVGAIETARIFLVDSDADTADIARAARGLLADPVAERAELVVPGEQDDDGFSRIEIHLKPGVMDPAAQSVLEVARNLGGYVSAAHPFCERKAWRFFGDMGTDPASRSINSAVCSSIPRT